MDLDRDGDKDIRVRLDGITSGHAHLNVRVLEEEEETGEIYVPGGIETEEEGAAEDTTEPAEETYEPEDEGLAVKYKIMFVLVTMAALVGGTGVSVMYYKKFNK